MDKHPLRFMVVIAGLVLASSFRPAAGQSPADRFVESLDAHPAIPAEAATLIREAWANCQDCDADEFLTQGLALLSAEFRDGLDAYDAERYGQCVSIMAGLKDDPNPFVKAHAAFYEIKALVAGDRLLEAGERILRLLDETADPPSDVGKYTYHAPEIAFLHGYCLLADLQYIDAAHALSRFLERYPDASPRLVMSARQMLAELRNRQPGRIGEVVDLMNYAARRLSRGDSGEIVQKRQQKVIDILDQLIEDAESQEQSASGSSGQRDSSGGRKPRSPMPDSVLPGGRPPEGPLREARRANPGDAWGQMPPAERERVLQAIRESFPSRYRQLVEQYYEQLAKQP